MAKQGQHNKDAHDYDRSKGPNKHDESVTITTGGGTVPAAHGGTGTDTGTPGIGPGAGPPGPHGPTADARIDDFDINAGTERATRRDDRPQ